MTLIRGGLAGLLPRVEVLFQVKRFGNLKEFARKFVGKCCRDCIKRDGSRENFIVTFLRHFVRGGTLKFYNTRLFEVYLIENFPDTERIH